MAGTELPDTITDKIIYEIIEYTNKLHLLLYIKLGF